jgi:capsular exopolysaccharide synthesis family protein
VNPRDYWKAIRRRWMDVVLAVIVALGAGWLITGVAPAGPPTKAYEATAVIVQTGNPFTVGNVSNLEAVAALSTIGDVPERVADELVYAGDPQDLVAQIKVDVDPPAGVIRYTSLTDDAEDAVSLANAFADQARAFLRDERSETIAQQSAKLSDQLDELQAEIEQLDDELAAAPPKDQGVIQAQRDAKVRQYGLLYEQYSSLALAERAPGGLEVVRANGAIPQSSEGLQAPRSRTSRLIIAGVLGVLSGIVIVLIADRFDARIRTREGAEKAFGFPILAELPFLKRTKRKAITTISEPRSHTANAFRIVTTMLSMKQSPGRYAGNGWTADGNGQHELPPMPGEERGSEPPRTILITSPGPDDGKTTVVANLAATFAARSKRTVVLSCDLRRPHIHRLLRAPNERGLTEVLERAKKDGPVEIPVEKTSIENVRLIPSGQPPPDPGELLGSAGMRSMLRTAREQSDVVLIDTAPILTTSDAIPLIDGVDAVVIVARSGRTTIETAKRTAELLRRLDAPVAGVILNAVAETNLPRRYYSSRYYRNVKTSRRREGKPRLARHSNRQYASKW